MELTLTVAQGIGDAYWVYQVFARHVDRIHFRVATTPTCPAWLEDRSFRFLLGLPKVASVEREVMSHDEYMALENGRVDPEAIVAAGGGRACCNAALRAGERLETIWPGHAVEYDAPIPAERPAGELPERYILLFVGEGSGMRDNPDCVDAWTPDHWVEFVGRVRKRVARVPVVVVGAEWDRHAEGLVMAGLNNLGIETVDKIGLPIEETSWLIQNAEIFLCYQAGLKCIADRFNTPQVVVWFPISEGVRYAFPRPENIASRRYQAVLFSTPPGEAAEAAQWPPD